MKNFKQKNIAVIGLGKSGLAAAKFLLKKGVRHLRVTDGSEAPEVLERRDHLRRLGVEVETGGHTENFLKGVDLMITSPGVPKGSLPLRYAKRHKISVLSEIEVASYFCPGPIVAVTGSNGKTTTCHLIYEMLKAGGKKTILCGNIGTAFLDVVNRIDRKTIVVLELSSFQLEDSPTFRPAIAVMTNICPNHLDRHGTIASYAKAKAQIFKNQGPRDVLVVNREDVILRRLAKGAKSRVVGYGLSACAQGVSRRGDEIICRDKKKTRYSLCCSTFGLKGDHNVLNAMAASAAVNLLGVRAATIQKVLDRFTTLEHRIENLGKIDGRLFVNDSKSTTVDSTRAAIESVPGPVVLIAGGRDKGVNFDALLGLLHKRVRAAVLYGESGPKIKDAWARKFHEVYVRQAFEEAVRLAFAKSVPGDTILLSPMCTSFDQFKSYGERGKVFKKIFHQLKIG